MWWGSVTSDEVFGLFGHSGRVIVCVCVQVRVCEVEGEGEDVSECVSVCVWGECVTMSTVLRESSHI